MHRGQGLRKAEAKSRGQRKLVEREGCTGLVTDPGAAGEGEEGGDRKALGCANFRAG